MMDTLSWILLIALSGIIGFLIGVWMECRTDEEPIVWVSSDELIEIKRKHGML